MENTEKLKIKINEFIGTVIDKADEDDKLDYFHIEISNHQGNLDMKYMQKKLGREFIKMDNVIYANNY